MKYDFSFFDKGVNRFGTRSEKWDDPVHCGKEDLAMWVADWDFACAEPIIKALQDRAQHPCFGYSSPDPQDEATFCGFWERRHNVKISPEQTMMMPCVVTGLKLAVRVFTNPGDKVVILPPVYGPFHFSIESNQRVIAKAPMLTDENARYHIDYDAIENHLKDGAKCVLFCNPHNPVSRVWSFDELKQLVDLCNQYSAVLISDEIHADFVFKPNEFISAMRIPDAENCVVCLTSASKTFNIPGLQQAMAFSRNADLLDKMKAEANAAGVTSGNIFALAATQKAYSECDDWLDGMLAYLEESKKIIETEIPRLMPKARLTPIEATCLCWIDLRAYAPTTEELSAKAKKHHVVFTGGTFFDPILGEGFQRLNFGCPHSMLREAIKRLAAAMNEE